VVSRERAWAAVAAVLLTVLVAAALVTGFPGAALVASMACVVAIGALIFKDSAQRGRSGWAWLIACIVLAPLAGPAFVVLAVLDRSRGRLGIESHWEPSQRPYLLTAVLLGIGAAVLALSPVRVQGASVTVPGGYGNFSGSCSSALSESLGGGLYSNMALAPAFEPAALSAAQAAVAERCFAAGSRRMALSGLCLAGGLVLAVIGAGMARRRGLRPWALTGAER
jgi:hypothetical protein